MNLPAIRAALRERNIDAWLFYDHHHRDPIAYRVLGLPGSMMVTRRWFYLVPAAGEPRKLVHRIEAGHLDSLPGSKRVYSGWQELFEQLQSLLGDSHDIAMQYSPNNLVFTVSLVDAGTIDLVRSLGKNVVSAADLIAQFEATWTEEQIGTHFEARDSVDRITAAAFQEIGRRVRDGGTDEYAMQQWILEAFRRENLVTDDPPVVAVNANSGNPHYEPLATLSRARATASTSSTAPVIPSAPRCIPMAPTWMISRSTTSAKSCPIPASPSNPASTFPSSGCAAKSTCWFDPGMRK